MYELLGLEGNLTPELFLELNMKSLCKSVDYRKRDFRRMTSGVNQGNHSFT